MEIFGLPWIPPGSMTFCQFYIPDSEKKCRHCKYYLDKSCQTGIVNVAYEEGQEAQKTMDELNKSKLNPKRLP